VGKGARTLTSVPGGIQPAEVVADITIMTATAAAPSAGSEVDRLALTADTMRPIAGGVALIFGGLVPVHLVTLPGSQGHVLAAGAALTALLLVGFWVVLGTAVGPALERHSQEVFAGCAAVTAANTLLHVAVVGDPWPTCAVMLVIVGIGGCLSSRSHAAAVILATDLAWAGIALTADPHPLWDEYATQMVAATILGAVMHLIRHKTVTRLERAQQALAVMAVTDELTGLKNRRGLLLAGEPLLELSRRQGSPVTILYLDVDGLKKVNDTQGHAAGDLLIAATGRTLQSVFRAADVVARLGGDEFAVLLTGTAPGAVEVVQERLRQGLAEEGISASVGLTRADPDRPDQTLGQLLDDADQAMYRMKRTR
jgi:diguanylate cyclase (GGDEF)-like protein